MSDETAPEILSDADIKAEVEKAYKEATGLVTG
jgi:hypothetical protein